MKEISELLRKYYTASVNSALSEFEYFPCYEPNNEENWKTTYGYSETIGDFNIGWLIDLTDKNPDKVEVTYKGHLLGKFTDDMVFGECSGPALVDYLNKAIDQVDGRTAVRT